jgi:hypothetical protein
LLKIKGVKVEEGAWGREMKDTKETPEINKRQEKKVSKE